MFILFTELLEFVDEVLLTIVGLLFEVCIGREVLMRVGRREVSVWMTALLIS